MKNIISLVLIFLCSFTLLTAQTHNQAAKKKVAPITTHQAGDLSFRLGVGVVPTFYQHEGTTEVPPISAILGYRVAKNVELGAYVGFTAATTNDIEYRDGSSYRYHNDFLILGLRAEARSVRTDNFELYGGVMAAYNQPFVEQTQLKGIHGTPTDEVGTRIVPSPTPYSVAPPKGTFLFSGFVGGSWYFAKNASLFGEIGYGVSIVTVGAGYKW